MRKKLHATTLLVLACYALSAQITYTWNGLLNSDWANGINWTSLMPGTAPGPMDDVIIAGLAAPNQPVLTADVSVRNVSISARASLDLRGFTIQISELLNITTGLGLLPMRSSINSGFIETGHLTVNNSRLNSVELTIVGSITGNKTINGQSIIDGACTFTNSNTANAPLVIASTLSSNVVFNDLVIFNRDLANINFATRGNITFNDEVALNIISTGNAGFASQGTITFNNNLYLNSSVGGNILFGAGGGTTTMTSGAALLTGSGFSGGGTIDLINFNQLSTAPNGFFEPNTFNTMDCFFGGDLSVDVINLSLTNTSFDGINDFIFRTGNVTSCTFNYDGGMASGSTTFTKTAATAVNWGGNNTFHSDFTFVKTGGGAVNLATAGGNTYRGIANFVNNNGLNNLNPLPMAGIKSQFFGDISTLGSTFPVAFGPGIMEIRGSSSRSFVGDPMLNHIVQNLELNMTGAGNLTLATPVQISGSAAFTYGVVNTDVLTPLVFLDNAVATLMLSNDSYVDGPVGKIGNDAFIFPVGNGGFLAPIAISAPSVITDSYAARYFHQDPVAFGGNNNLSGGDHISNAEYWALGASVGSSNVNVTLSWADRSGGVTDMSALVLSQWDGSDWVDAGTGATAGSNAAGTISTAIPLALGVPSYFTLGSTLAAPTNPLPIELLNFDARAIENKTVAVNWTTATERDNAYFVVERSSNGVRFETVGQLEGAGSSFTTQYYQFIDPAPLNGISYYRLRQVNYDETYSFSPIASVELFVQNSNIRVFPNPASDLVNISWSGSYTPSITIFNSTGQQIAIQINVSEGFAYCNVNNLASGIYTIQVNNEDHIQTQRIVVK